MLRRVLGLLRTGLLSVAVVAALTAPAWSTADLDALRTDARAGSADAQLALGTFLLTSQDAILLAEGIGWLEKAARQGVPVYVLLGDVYRDGIGAEQDYARAADWYRIAAELGDGLAQFELGRLYLDGDGVERDMVQAVLYLQLAVHRIHDPALREEADEELKRAKWWTSWEEWKKAKALIDNWQPKALPDLLN